MNFVLAMALTIQIVSGNLNEYGTNGSFEDVVGTWGFGVDGYGTLSRDASLKYEGDHSLKNESLTDFVIGAFTVAKANYSAGFIQGLKYLARARVYVDNALPIANDDCEFSFDGIVIPFATDETRKTVAQARGQWVEIEARWQAGLLSPSNTLVLTLLQKNIGNAITIGHSVWVDKLEIYQYIEVDSCSLQFNLPNCFVTNATNSNSFDGKINLGFGLFPAFSNPGGTTPIKVNLGADFNYATQGTAMPPSGTIILGSLPPGTYTVYARTGSSCLRTAQFSVGVNLNYGIRHRLEFHDLVSSGANRKWRLDILEKEYTGAIADAIGAGQSPVRYEWEGNGTQSIFERKVVASKIMVSLVSQTENQYAHLYTLDERQYLAQLYLHNGTSYQLWMAGWLLSQTWQEQYVISTNYPLQFIFADGLGDLSNRTFADSNGNPVTGRISFIDAIRLCLAGTDLNYQIREAVNMLSDSLPATSSGDSLLSQVFVDPANYRNDDGTYKDCQTVLEYIMGALLSRIYFAEGQWNVELITQKPETNVSVRLFPFSGSSISSATETPRAKLRRPRSTPGSPRIMWMDQSQGYQIAERFGVITLDQNLNIKNPNNMLLFGQFNDEDIMNGQVSGWNIDRSQAPFSSVQLERRENKADDYALSLTFYPLKGEEIITITSSAVNWNQNIFPAKIKIKFDTLTRPTFERCYIALDYKLSIAGNSLFTRGYGFGTFSFNGQITDPFSGITVPNPYLVDGQWNRIFLESHLKWQTIEVEGFLDPLSSIPAGDLVFTFRLSSNPVYDVDTFAELKDQQIDNIVLSSNYFRRLKDGNNIRTYKAEITTDAESLPDLVRTNANPGVRSWRLVNTQAYPTTPNGTNFESWLQNILIDNVEVGLYPDSEFTELNAPPQSILTTAQISPLIKNNLTVETEHADIGFDQDVNLPLISRSWISYFSTLFNRHVPVRGNWYRRGVTESYSFQQLLMQMLRGQYIVPRRYYTGSIDTRWQAISLWNTVYEYRTGIVGIITGLSVDCALNSANIEFIEALKGDPVEDVGEPTPPPSEPPVGLREHTSEFDQDFA